MSIEFDGQAARVRVSDPRLFHPGRRAYAHRLLAALCDQPGVRKAEVDLGSSSCRVDFDPASNAPEVMAGAFADALRAASARTEKAPWWRRGPGWSALTAYRSGGETSFWETHADRPGPVRLFGRGASKDRTRLAARVADLEGVERCRVSRRSGRIEILCEPGGSTLDRVERFLEEGGTLQPRASVIATGWRRWKYGAMAGGAFTMTLVGLVIPGIPTLPFLLATGYYLARSSPRMDRRLRRTVFIGPILSEWEGHGALSRASKARLIGLTATVILVTVTFLQVNAVLLVVILVMATASVYGISRMPTLPDDEAAAPGRTPLALTAG